MSSSIDALLIDLSGVLMDGNIPYLGAIDTLSKLLEAEFPFLILTNKTMGPRSEVVSDFRRAGLELSIDLIQAPPAAAAHWLRQQGQVTVAPIVLPNTLSEFEQLSLLPEDAEQGADYLVLGDLGGQWTYRKLVRAFRLLLNGAQLIALGMGRFWPSADGLRPGTGAFASGLAFACSKDPIVIGKPSSEYFQIAIEQLGLSPQRIAMVGDDIVSDVGAAQQSGLKGVLVQTGKFRPQDLGQDIKPDWVLSDITQVLPLLDLD